MVKQEISPQFFGLGGMTFVAVRHQQEADFLLEEVGAFVGATKDGRGP
jgi:hypothetical protein